jgi:hypothetical protein
VPAVPANTTQGTIHVHCLSFQNLEEPTPTDQKTAAQPVPAVELVGDGGDIGEGRNGWMALLR